MAGRFDSAGAGLSRGLQAGVALRQQKTKLGQNQQALDQAEQEMAQKKVEATMANVAKAREATEASIAGWMEILREEKAKGASPEQLAPTVAVIEGLAKDLGGTVDAVAMMERTNNINLGTGGLTGAQVVQGKRDAVSALLAATQAPKTTEDIAKEEAEGKIAGAKALSAEAPVDQRQDAFFRLIGVDKPEVKGEFLTLLGALKDTKPGSPEFKFIQRRLEKLSTQSGIQTFSVSVDGEKNITLTAGPGGQAVSGTGGGVPTLKGGQVDELRGQASALRTGIQISDGVLQAIETDPSRFGAAGTVRGSAEVTAEMLTDIASLGIKSLGVDLEGAASSLNEFIDIEDADPKVKKALRPVSAGAVSVWEGILRYGVARALQPEGKLLASTISAAADITDLTGLKSTQRVKEKMTEIRQIMVSAETKLQRRTEQGVTGTATTPEVSPLANPQPGPSDLDGQVSAIFQKLKGK